MTSVRDLEKLVATPAMQVAGGRRRDHPCVGQTRGRPRRTPT